MSGDDHVDILQDGRNCISHEIIIAIFARIPQYPDVIKDLGMKLPLGEMSRSIKILLRATYKDLFVHDATFLHDGIARMQMGRELLETGGSYAKQFDQDHTGDDPHLGVSRRRQSQAHEVSPFT